MLFLIHFINLFDEDVQLSVCFCDDIFLVNYTLLNSVWPMDKELVDVVLKDFICRPLVI
jgi:hypothetical protein